MQRVLVLLGLLVVVDVVLACGVDADCPVPEEWCSYAPFCNKALARCETRPRCATPALPYCDPTARKCAATLPKITIGASPKSLLALGATRPCETDACCVDQVRAAYRFTEKPATRLPWCVQSVHVSESGTGCEITPRCAAGEACDQKNKRCSTGGVRAADVVLCVSDGDCDDGVFCNGVETCSVASMCQGSADPPCHANASFPHCDEASHLCTAVDSNHGLGFPLWVIIIVAAVSLCFVLCVIVLCSMNVQRGYDVTERAAVGLQRPTDTAFGVRSTALGTGPRGPLVYQ